MRLKGLHQRHLEFLLTVLRWGELGYEEKAAKYMDDDEYRKGTYRQTINDYREVRIILQDARRPKRKVTVAMPKGHIVTKEKMNSIFGKVKT